MNATVFLLSILLISCNVNVTSGTIFFVLRYQLAMKEYLNSFFNSEIIIDGATAEEIYFMERADQITSRDKALKRREELLGKSAEAKKFSIFDLIPAKLVLTVVTKLLNIGRRKYQLHAINEKINRITKEMGVNKFCSMPDMCNRAFKNSYFTEKNHWILEDKDSIKTNCVEKTMVISRGGKSIPDMRKYVKCETRNEKDGSKGPDVFLEASTRYMPGKNLKYIVLLDDKGYVKPVAYLMNKEESESVIEIPIEESQKPLLGEKASKTDKH